ncbi:5-deoxy-glucuronate isomerase [Streptomyces sp. RFCAC02]|uniref:5-deoxy-glucuronate isomerase n=1 Tax=Streptomyces sp. RFCAC02 TaxID=2499143 RepID=UPI0019D25936|nr:5-deoxy-glucuronate isomerase [Streptomyces sp. RFCAC02]
MEPRLHLPAGSAASGPYDLHVSPDRAGWSYASLRVLTLPPGGGHTFAAGDSEWIVLPLAGGATVTADEAIIELTGRADVFAGVSDFAYVPRDTARVTVASAGGGRFALAGARCARRLPARYGPAGGVPVELRGAGTCSRQVHNFAAADVFDADRLIAVEVYTPGGNWSSYPPHKHDESRPGEESCLEEIYYYEIAPEPGVRPPADAPAAAAGFQRVSPSGPDRTTDVLTEVRDGDAVLIPDGWHGPSIAPPGHTLYYLNVMAGPDPDRAWLIRDHPDHAWLRTTWPGTPVDPRLPLARRAGSEEASR